jgi:DNA-binding transcriptional regulator YiaG
MGKLEATLKSEIMRLARREVRPVLGPLVAQVRALSRQVRALTADTQRLTRATRKLETERSAKVAQLKVPDTELATSRMSAGLIKKLRGRHGITQQQLALLVGVSAAAVQSWEQGIARPTGDNRVALVALRKLPPADVTKLMEQKGIAKAKRRPRTRMAKAAAPAKKTAKKAGHPKKVAKKAKRKVAKKAKRKVGRPKAAKKAKRGRK